MGIPEHTAPYVGRRRIQDSCGRRPANYQSQLDKQHTAPCVQRRQIRNRCGRRTANYQNQVENPKGNEQQTRIGNKKTEAETSIKLVEPNWVITVQHHTKGPLINGSLFGKSAEIFPDTGSMMNLISRDILQRFNPKVKLVDSTPFSLQGVTGNKLETLGETLLTVALTNNIHITIPVITVEKSIFPGDLLIRFQTMRVENITISPAEHGAQISDVFLPFIILEVLAEPLATVPLIRSESNEKTKVESPSSLNNVAERSPDNNTSTEGEGNFETQISSEMKTPTETIPREKQCRIIPTLPQKKTPHQKFKKPEQDITEIHSNETSGEALKIVTGHVIESTLLHGN